MSIGASVLIKAALQFEHGVVVQPARDETFVLEHKLPGEELRLRKFFGDHVAQLRRLVHDVRAERDMRLGVKTALAHVGDITLALRVCECSRRFSTSDAPLKLPASSTPTCTKTKFW